MSSPTNGAPRQRSRLEDPALREAVDLLIDRLPPERRNRDILTRLVERVVTLPSQCDRLELKILRSALDDFSGAFEVFGQYRDRPKVSVFGSARTPEGSPLYEHARKFAAALVERGFMAITGAGPGIMQAGNQGATAEHSFGVNINLPFEQESNPYIRGDAKLVKFKYFFTRKLAFVKESAAVVLFPGGMGTQDEGFETLTLIQTGKREPIPVILFDLPGGDYWIQWEMFIREVLLEKGLISADDFNLFRYTTDIDKAIHEIELFYRNYHSLMYVGRDVIIRLKHPPTTALLDELNRRYRSLLSEGQFEAMAEPHEFERSEGPEIRSLHRIRFSFVQRRFGTLRRMIDTINLRTLNGSQGDGP